MQPAVGAAPPHEDAIAAASLQTWLRGCSSGAVLVGWPALQALSGKGLPSPPSIEEGALSLPAAIAAWRVLVPRGADVPPLPSQLPLLIEPIAVAAGWPEAVHNYLEQSTFSSLAVGVDGDGRVYDPLGGLADGQAGRLRLSPAVRERLRGQYALVLDTSVVAAWTGLRPGGDWARSLRRDHTLVLTIARQLWCDGLNATLAGPHAATGLRFLHEAAVLQLLVPEATAMVDFHKSCPVHHKDIWDHTLQVIEKCPPNLVVRWAALMHDVGKVLTRSVSKGKVHFFGHEQVGALLMEGVAARLGLPDRLRDRVTYVIAHHARANAYLGNWTDSAVRRLVKDMGEHLPDVLAFSRSDWTTKRAGRIAEVQSLTQELAARIPAIVAETQRVPPLPKGLGTFILGETGLQAGPWLGRLQAWLEAACERGELLALQSPQYYLDAVRQHAPQLLDIAPGTERQRR